jgi:hypothetical protein
LSRTEPAGEAVDGEERDRILRRNLFLSRSTRHCTGRWTINPGAIIEYNKGLVVHEDEEGFDLDAPFPCILFLDSLNAHQKAKVVKKCKPG